MVTRHEAVDHLVVGDPESMQHVEVLLECVALHFTMFTCCTTEEEQNYVTHVPVVVVRHHVDRVQQVRGLVQVAVGGQGAGRGGGGRGNSRQLLTPQSSTSV